MHSLRGAAQMDGQRHVHHDSDALADSVAGRLIALWQAAPRTRPWHIALAGGNTPRAIYARLRHRQAELDWSAVEVWFGDERDVAPDHPDSNYRMAREALLAHVPIPDAHVHPMRSPHLDLRRDCARYARLLDTRLPRRDGWPRFDVILLGLGSDGHTASLFPNTCILHQREQTVAPVHVAQLGTWRMSLTLPVLEQAEHLLFVVSGAAKAAVLKRAWARPEDAALPVNRIRPHGTVEWHVDGAAAGAVAAPEQRP